MKAAIYLYGHGPYREPRLIELQYLRIKRYLDVLSEQIEESILVEKIYTDINFPRSDWLDRLLGLQELIKDIKEKNINVICIDICIGDSFNPYKNEPVINTIEGAGAKVYNRYYDDDSVMISRFREHYSHEYDVYFQHQNDADDFVTLFPALASSVCYSALSDVMENVPAGGGNTEINRIASILSMLAKENPYNSLSIPWISNKTSRKIFKIKYEQDQKDLKERRKNEDLYIIEPDGEGKLIDELIFNSSRSNKEFHWAIKRLQELDFKHIIYVRFHSFTMDYKGCEIYADLRKKGSIDIAVYKLKPLKKQRGNKYSFLGSFKLQDNWKKDLNNKLISRLDSIIESKK